MKLYLEGQDVEVGDVLFEQDNQATIRLEENGRVSASKRLRRHVDIHYFFIKDKIKSYKFTLRYCNTAVMLADFLTKPLQGKLFRFFRAVLLGHKHISALSELLPNHDLRVEEVVSRTGNIRPGKKRTACARIVTERRKWEEGRTTHPALSQPLMPDTIKLMGD